MSWEGGLLIILAALVQSALDCFAMWQAGKWREPEHIFSFGPEAA